MTAFRLKSRHLALVTALGAALLATACEKSAEPAKPDQPVTTPQSPVPQVQIPQAQLPPLPQMPTPTSAIADFPDKPTVEQSDGNLLLRCKGIGGRYNFELRTRVPKIGELFTVTSRVFDAQGHAAGQGDFSVDATMPDHGHGMMTQPTHKSTISGTWRSEGLKLHMPGHWQIVANFESAEARDTCRFDWQQSGEATP